MRVLVIGGTRFLGYHIVKGLLEKEIEVVLFNRGKMPDDFGDQVKRIRGDRKDYKKFFETFHRERFDAVIDVIGYDPEDIEVAIKTFRDHIGQYIFISTGQVYLVTENKHLPSREEDYYQPLIECPPGEEVAYEYGVKKRQCEDLLEEAYQFHKFPAVRFRLPIIHGPRDYTLRLYSYLIRIQDEHPLIITEDGNSLIRHIYVKDVVRTILSVLQVEKTRGKVYNLASEEVLRLSDFIQLCARIMQKPVKIYEIPEAYMHEFGVPREVSPFSGLWVSYMDPALAIEELKFSSTPVEEWLKETVDWFLTEYTGTAPENYRYRRQEINLAEFWKRFKKLE